MKGKLTALFYGGLLLASFPLLAHALVVFVAPTAHFTNKELFVDVLLLGLAILTASYMDGTKLLLFGDVADDQMKIVISLIVLTLGTGLLGIFYGLAVAEILAFSWRVWLYCLVMIGAFSVTAFFLSVKYTANELERR
jgi:hypothetical protein